MQRPHPEHFQKRFPAHETENLVEQEIRQYLGQKEKLVVLFGLDEVADYSLIELIIGHQETIPFGKMVEGAIGKIIVKKELICIRLNVGVLASILSDGMGRRFLKAGGEEEIHWLEVHIKRGNRKEALSFLVYKMCQRIFWIFILMDDMVG